MPKCVQNSHHTSGNLPSDHVQLCIDSGAKWLIRFLSVLFKLKTFSKHTVVIFKILCEIMSKT